MSRTSRGTAKPSYVEDNSDDDFTALKSKRKLEAAASESKKKEKITKKTKPKEFVEELICDNCGEEIRYNASSSHLYMTSFSTNL